MLVTWFCEEVQAFNGAAMALCTELGVLGGRGRNRYKEKLENTVCYE